MKFGCPKNIYNQSLNNIISLNYNLWDPQDQRKFDMDLDPCTVHSHVKFYIIHQNLLLLIFFPNFAQQPFLAL